MKENFRDTYGEQGTPGLTPGLQSDIYKDGSEAAAIDITNSGAKTKQISKVDDKNQRG